MSKTAAIYVTKPALPPLEEFIPYLEQIWESRILTNGGPFHSVGGSIRRIFGSQPYRIIHEWNDRSRDRTTSSAYYRRGHYDTIFIRCNFYFLLWNGIKPVFVDVYPDTLNLDPLKIEAAITPQTTAIMPVHCYGHPCDTKAIQAIADIYNLKVIYDASSRVRRSRRRRQCIETWRSFRVELSRYESIYNI